MKPKQENECQATPDPDPATAGTASERALAEAAARRAALDGSPARPEVGGRGGLDPVRFGDWEVKGLATDF